MPRRINPVCLACAQLDAEGAISLHGPKGDDCWDSKRCPRRRSHYRNRRENNAKRRAERIVAQGKPVELGPERVTISLDLNPVAYLYLYREKRKDSPLHALAISVWEGDKKVMEIEPIHCSGLRNRQISDYLSKALAYLKTRYGISKFESEVRMEPLECPISPCPLKALSEELN